MQLHRLLSLLLLLRFLGREKFISLFRLLCSLSTELAGGRMTVYVRRSDQTILLRAWISQEIFVSCAILLASAKKKCLLEHFEQRWVSPMTCYSIGVFLAAEMFLFSPRALLFLYSLACGRLLNKNSEGDCLRDFDWSETFYQSLPSPSLKLNYSMASTLFHPLPRELPSRCTVRMQ